MRRNESIYVCAVVVTALLILASCASPVSPIGGPRDTTPPQLIPAESAPPLATGFAGERLEFTFDEFVELRDPTTQVVISPPLDHRLSVTARKRSVIVEFDEEEELRSNTTYTINFGDAVRDYTEGNIIRNFRYVFSTGPVIDSMSFRARVVDAQSGEPEGNVLVMLYDGIDDSLVVKEKPYYFGKTDSSGRVELSYLKPDTFLAIALEDQDLNLHYDEALEERVGFLSGPVLLHPDTQAEASFRMFSKPLDPLLTGADKPYPGHYRIILEGNQDFLGWRAEPEQDLVHRFSADSLLLWVRGVDSLRKLILAHKGVVFDTASLQKLRPLDTVASFANPRGESAKTGLTFRGEKAAVLRSSVPLLSVDTSRIAALDTGGRVVSGLRLGDFAPASFGLSLGFPAPARLDEVVFLPGALEDISGMENDSIRFSVEYLDPGKLSNLLIRFSGLDSTAHYLAEFREGDQILERLQIDSLSVSEWAFEGLPPRHYEVWLIRDSNANGRYDRGDYWEKQQPEPVVIRQIQNLRPNWDVEIEIVFTKQTR